MHILNSDPLQELRALQAALAAGDISQAEFAVMYRDLDRTNATALCERGDSRIAVVILGGRKLCGICARLQERQHGQ